MKVEQTFPTTAVVSSKMFDKWTPRIAPESVNFARRSGLEWVIDKAEDLNPALRPSDIVSGIHFRAMKSRGFQHELDLIVPQVRIIVDASSERTIARPYISFHTDLLATLKDHEIDQYLHKLNEQAEKEGILILLENTTPRIDGANKDWCYDPHAFVSRFKNIFESCPNIRVNLDLAHLGLSTKKPYQVLHKFYLASTRGAATDNILTRMNREEIELYKDLAYIIGKTEVVHWSRTRGEPMLERKDFRVAQAIVSKLPRDIGELIHNKVYSWYDNVLYAHFSIISNPKLLYELSRLMDHFNFQGLYVIESHGAVQRGREWQAPFKEELQALWTVVAAFRGLPKHQF